MEKSIEFITNKLVNINDNKWQDIDSIVCSMLTYLKYPIEDNTSILELYNKYNDNKLLSILINNPRYKNIIINNVTRIIDDNIQFEAMKIDIDGYKCIAFAGTDNSMIGWKENFKIGYLYPTETQKEAIKYVTNNIEKDIILVGHSKGGNLALVSYINQNRSNKYKISKVYNLDGPGLPVRKTSKKIITYIPENSFVGSLMYNINTNIIKSQGLGFIEHHLNNWYIDNYKLVKSIQSKYSITCHNKSIYAVNNYDKKQAKLIVDSFFNILKNDNINTWIDVNNFDSTNLYNELNKLSIDREIKEYYINIFKSMIR